MSSKMCGKTFKVTKSKFVPLHALDTECFPKIMCYFLKNNLTMLLQTYQNGFSFGLNKEKYKNFQDAKSSGSLNYYDLF